MIAQVIGRLHPLLVLRRQRVKDLDRFIATLRFCFDVAQCVRVRQLDFRILLDQFVVRFGQGLKKERQSMNFKNVKQLICYLAFQKTSSAKFGLFEKCFPEITWFGHWAVF